MQVILGSKGGGGLLGSEGRDEAEERAFSPFFSFLPEQKLLVLAVSKQVLYFVFSDGDNYLFFFL